MFARVCDKDPRPEAAVTAAFGAAHRGARPMSGAWPTQLARRKRGSRATRRACATGRDHVRLESAGTSCWRPSSQSEDGLAPRSSACGRRTQGRRARRTTTLATGRQLKRRRRARPDRGRSSPGREQEDSLMWMTRVSITTRSSLTMVMVGFRCWDCSPTPTGRGAECPIQPAGVQIWVNYPLPRPNGRETWPSPLKAPANTVAGVKASCRAPTRPLKLTWVEFRYEVDMDRAMQEVRDKLAHDPRDFPARREGSGGPGVPAGEKRPAGPSFRLMGPTGKSRASERCCRTGRAEGFFERVKGGRVASILAATRRADSGPGSIQPSSRVGLSVDTVVAGAAHGEHLGAVSGPSTTTRRSRSSASTGSDLAGTVSNDHRRAQKWRPDPAVAGSATLVGR